MTKTNQVQYRQNSDSPIGSGLGQSVGGHATFSHCTRVVCRDGGAVGDARKEGKRHSRITHNKRSKATNCVRVSGGISIVPSVQLPHSDIIICLWKSELACDSESGIL